MGEPQLSARLQGFLDPTPCVHAAQLYHDDPFLGEAVVEFLAAGLRSGEGAVMIATLPRWQAAIRRLEQRDIETQPAIQSGRLRYFGAQMILSQCMASGTPDSARFAHSVGTMLGLVRRSYPQLRVFTDLADYLWSQKSREAALALENCWNELIRKQPISLLCACPLDCLDGAAYDDGTFQRVCAAHTHVAPSRNSGWLDDAVMQAANELLEPQLAYMLQAMSETQRPATHMPPGQATLLWLKENMPRTAEKVLARVRERAGLA